LFLPHIGYGNPLLVEHATNFWSFRVSHKGHYFHENCTYFDTDMALPDSYNDTDFMEKYCPYGNSVKCYAWLAVLRTFVAPDMEGLIIEIFKGYMRDLYCDLGTEYEYLTSDEVVWEAIEANELNRNEQGGDHE